MNFKYNLSIVVACLALAALTNGHSFINSDNSLLSFMSRSNEILAQNPAHSLECFNYYIPLINKLAEQYELNYKACLNLSEIERANADNATLDQRLDLANAAEASCNLLSKCGDSSSVSDIFQCYIDGGSSNINTMYVINANASVQLANLREQYYLIENKEFRCTNDTKRAYEKESAEAYASLNNCILGISDIPTEAPSSTNTPTTSNSPSTSTDTTTTNASSSSTDPTTTNASSSSTDTTTTNAPSSSTETTTTDVEPSTETPSILTTTEASSR